MHSNACPRVVVVLAAITLAALASICPAQPCNDELIVGPNEWLVLRADACYERVRIAGRLDVDGCTLTVTDAGGLTISPGGELLLVGLAGTVALAGGGTHTIDGDMLLLDEAVMLDIAQTTTLGGQGSVVGADATAAIRIGCGKTLTNALDTGGITGSMQISGLTGTQALPGTFSNQGRVVATGGVLRLAADTVVTDAPGDRWFVAAGGALQFSREALALGGDFVVNGTLDLDQHVKTCGQLTFNSGASIDVEAGNGKTFRFLTFNAASTCSNPADSGGGTDCATDPYVVSTDHLNCN